MRAARLNCDFKGNKYLINIYNYVTLWFDLSWGNYKCNGDSLFLKYVCYRICSIIVSTFKNLY